MSKRDAPPRPPKPSPQRGEQKVRGRRAEVAPDQPIDQSVLPTRDWSARLFIAAVQKAGKKLTTASRENGPPTRRFTYDWSRTRASDSTHDVPAADTRLPRRDGDMLARRHRYTVKAPKRVGASYRSSMSTVRVTGVRRV